MILSFAKFLMQGRVYFCLGVFLLASLPFLLWLAAGFVVLVTLRRGAFDGALALLCAMLPMALMAAMSGFSSSEALSLPTEAAPAPENIALLQGLVFWNDAVVLIVVYTAAVILRETVKLNVTLVAIAVSICAIVLSGLLPVQHWMEFFKLNYEQLTRLLPQDYGQALSDISGAKQVELFRIIASHYLSLTLLVQAYMGLFLGRWLQSLLYNPGGFGIEFRSLSYSGLAATLMIFTGVMLDRVVPEAAGVAWVLTAPVVTVGVALVHFIIHVKKVSFSGWLVGFYFLLPFTYSIVAIVGWLDALWRFRSKMKKTCAD